MKTNVVKLLLAASICAPALFCQELKAAKGSGRTQFCDLSILKGHYAVTLSGTRPAPLVLPAFPSITPGTIEQVVGAFTLIFDGNGGIRMGENPIVKGAYSGLFPDKSGTGTYTVNADCSGNFTINMPQLPAPLVNSMVVIGGGKEFRSVVTAPQALMITTSGALMN